MGVLERFKDKRDEIELRKAKRQYAKQIVAALVTLRSVFIVYDADFQAVCHREDILEWTTKEAWGDIIKTQRYAQEVVGHPIYALMGEGVDEWATHDEEYHTFYEPRLHPGGFSLNHSVYLSDTYRDVWSSLTTEERRQRLISTIDSDDYFLHSHNAPAVEQLKKNVNESFRKIELAKEVVASVGDDIGRFQAVLSDIETVTSAVQREQPGLDQLRAAMNEEVPLVLTTRFEEILSSIAPPRDL